MSAFPSSWIGPLVRRLLSGSFSHAAGTAQKMLNGIVRNLVHGAVARLRKIALSYAPAAAFGIAAVVSISFALAQALVAAGLAAWAAHLVVAVLTGGVAWVLFPRSASAGREEDDTESDPVPETRERQDPVAIKIVNVVRRPPARTRKAISRPRPKKRRRVIRVRARGKQWEVTGARSRSVKRVYATRTGAVRAARAIARKTSAPLIVQESARPARKVIRVRRAA